MAKLSAYGQKEVSRWAREQEGALYLGGPVWSRVTYAFMDNGRCLVKRNVRWTDGSTHYYSWKVLHPVGWGNPERLLKVYALLEKAGFSRKG